MTAFDPKQTLHSAMPRYLSALVLGFVVSAALAGDDDSVKQPYVEVGDCWTYSKTFVSKKGKPGYNYKLCVTYVDRAKNLIIAVETKSGGPETDEKETDEKETDEKESNLTFTAEWDRLNDRHAVRRSSHFLKFPLHVGDTYSFDSEYQLVDTADHKKGKRKWDMKVVGWEDIAVPAGTFRSMRIEGFGANSKNFSRVTMWYVPEVNRNVKEIWAPPGRDATVDELTQYRPKK